MKKILIILIPLMFIFQTTACTDSWKKTIETPVSVDVLTAGFLNEKCGFIGGSTDIDQSYTLDGGKTWTNAGDMPVGPRYDIEIIDDKTFLSIGDSGIIITEDQGKTWDVISRVCWQLISFTDKDNGWAAEEIGKLEITNDRGKTWHNSKLPAALKYLAAVSIFDKTSGYLLDKEGNLFKTKDSGNTWDIIRIDLKNIKLSYSCITSDMVFINENTGIIAARIDNDKDQWAIIKTKDGGKKWSVKIINESTGASHISRDMKYITILTSTSKTKVIVHKNY